MRESFSQAVKTVKSIPGVRFDTDYDQGNSVQI